MRWWGPWISAEHELFPHPSGELLWCIPDDEDGFIWSTSSDPVKHNEQLKLYSDAIAKIAAERGYGYVNLFDHVRDGSKENPPRPLTDNGIHYSDYGARRIGWAMITELTDITPSISMAQLTGDGAERFGELRTTINQKNREFFYRWRPQNETYIFGFRKNEQGKNAVEIPQFDPIIEKLEEKINRLKK